MFGRQGPITHWDICFLGYRTALISQGELGSLQNPGLNHIIYVLLCPRPKVSQKQILSQTLRRDGKP